MCHSQTESGSFQLQLSEHFILSLYSGSSVFNIQQSVHYFLCSYGSATLPKLEMLPVFLLAQNHVN